MSRGGVHGILLWGRAMRGLVGARTDPEGRGRPGQAGPRSLDTGGWERRRLTEMGHEGLTSDGSRALLPDAGSATSLREPGLVGSALAYLAARPPTASGISRRHMGQ